MLDVMYLRELLITWVHFLQLSLEFISVVCGYWFN